MDGKRNLSECQNDFSTLYFPANPHPPLAAVGTLSDQFKVLDTFLSLPDPIRERDPDLVWSVVCGVVEYQKGAM